MYTGHAPLRTSRTSEKRKALELTTPFSVRASYAAVTSFVNLSMQTCGTLSLVNHIMRRAGRPWCGCFLILTPFWISSWNGDKDIAVLGAAELT